MLREFQLTKKRFGMEINMMMVTLLLWTLMQRGGTSTPVERVVVAGSSVELRCDIPYDRSKDFHWVESNYGGILRRLANKPPDEFQLFHPGFRDRVSLEGPDGVDLRIENVKKEDEGSYNCQEEGAERDGTLQKLLVADALPERRLSGGAIAGISVGSVIVFFIIIGITIAITICCYKRKKANRRGDKENATVMDSMNPGQDQTNQKNEPEGPSPDASAETDSLIAEDTKLGVNLPDKTTGQSTKDGACGVSSSHPSNSAGSPQSLQTMPDDPEAQKQHQERMVSIARQKAATQSLQPGAGGGTANGDIPMSHLPSEEPNGTIPPGAQEGAANSSHVEPEDSEDGPSSSGPATGEIVVEHEGPPGTPGDHSEPEEPSGGLETGESAQDGPVEQPSTQPIQPSNGAEGSLPFPVTVSSGAGQPTLPESTPGTMWPDIYNKVGSNLPAQRRSSLARVLGLGEADISNIEEDNQRNGHEKLHQVLVLWREQNPTASPEALAMALRRCRCNAVAHMVEELWLSHDRR